MPNYYYFTDRSQKEVKSFFGFIYFKNCCYVSDSEKKTVELEWKNMCRAIEVKGDDVRILRASINLHAFLKHFLFCCVQTRSRKGTVS